MSAVHHTGELGAQALQCVLDCREPGSERGYLGVRQHDYESAIRDEARAIQLDPRLARAYFLAGVAFGDLGNHANAVSDIRTAVDLDPSLVRYVTIKGKTVSLALPPL